MTHIERGDGRRFSVFITIYLLVFVICAVNPYDRSVWWAENLPMWLIIAGICLARRWVSLSTTSYILMSFLLILHTIGGHFTFERVPFEWVSEWFGFERNHYDRMAHFTVGFYAYPLAEILLRRRLCSSRVLLTLFPLFSIFTVAALYEIFEWRFAISADPTAGSAVLGSQGDLWDAQKDMLSDGLGGVFAMILFLALNRTGISGITANWKNAR